MLLSSSQDSTMTTTPSNALSLAPSMLGSTDSAASSLSSASPSSDADATLSGPNWLPMLIDYVSQQPALLAAYTTRISPRSASAAAHVANRSVSPTETYELLNGFNKRINGPGVLVLQAMCDQFEQTHQRLHAQLGESAACSHTYSWPEDGKDRRLLADLVEQGHTTCQAWHDAVFLAGKGITWAAASRAQGMSASPERSTGSTSAMASTGPVPGSCDMAAVASTDSLSSAGDQGNGLAIQGVASRQRAASEDPLTSDEEDNDQVEASTSALRRSNRASKPSRSKLPRSLTLALDSDGNTTGARKRRRKDTTTPRPRASASPARSSRTPRRPRLTLQEQLKADAQTQTAAAAAAASSSGSSPSMPSSSIATEVTSLFSSPLRPVSASPFASGAGVGGSSTISQRLVQLEELVMRQNRQIEALQAQNAHNDQQVLNAIGEVHAAHEAERERRKAYEADAEKRAEERNAQLLAALAKVGDQQQLLRTDVDSMHGHLIEHL